MLATITGNHKNDLRFFTDLCDDYINDPMGSVKASEKKKQFKGVLQAFVALPYEKREVIIQAYQRRIIQAFGVSTDFTKLPRNAFDLTIEALNFDLGYERAFKTVMLDANTLSWTMYTAYNNITVRKVMEGGRIRVDNISGDHADIECDYYGGALGFTDKMIRARHIPAMIDRAEAFRNVLYNNKATNHYALLAAAALLHVTAYDATGTGELQRDINTINLAAYTLTNRCKDKGYGDMANASLIMYYNPLRRGRVLAALSATTATLAPAGAGGRTINYNIEPIATFNSAISTTNPILVLPGNKIQKAEAMAPTTYQAPFDPLTLNQTYAIWNIYGAAIGDDEQCESITLT